MTDTIEMTKIDLGWRATAIIDGKRRVAISPFSAADARQRMARRIANQRMAPGLRSE